MDIFTQQHDIVDKERHLLLSTTKSNHLLFQVNTAFKAFFN